MTSRKLAGGLKADIRTECKNAFSIGESFIFLRILPPKPVNFEGIDLLYTYALDLSSDKWWKAECGLYFFCFLETNLKKGTEMLDQFCAFCRIIGKRRKTSLRRTVISSGMRNAGATCIVLHFWKQYPGRKSCGPVRGSVHK